MGPPTKVTNINCYFEKTTGVFISHPQIGKIRDSPQSQPTNTVVVALAARSKPCPKNILPDRDGTIPWPAPSTLEFPPSQLRRSALPSKPLSKCWCLAATAIVVSSPQALDKWTFSSLAHRDLACISRTGAMLYAGLSCKVLSSCWNIGNAPNLAASDLKCHMISEPLKVHPKPRLNASCFLTDPI